jgi:hypothetical protein
VSRVQCDFYDLPHHDCHEPTIAFCFCLFDFQFSSISSFAGVPSPGHPVSAISIHSKIISKPLDPKTQTPITFLSHNHQRWNPFDRPAFCGLNDHACATSDIVIQRELRTLLQRGQGSHQAKPSHSTSSESGPALADVKPNPNQLRLIKPAWLVLGWVPA